MTQTNVFGLTAAMVKKKLNPLNHEFGFQYGSSYDVAEADVDEVNALMESTVLSRLPERYRILCRRVDGEILTDYSEPDRDSYQLGLYPVSGVNLYRDYGKTSWSARNYSDMLVYHDDWTEDGDSLTVTDAYQTTWTLDTTTGELSCSPALPQGSTLIAEYEHTASAVLLQLRQIAMGLVAGEWGRRLPSNAETYGRYEGWEKQAYSDLNRMQERGDGKLGIDELDELTLVQETRASVGAIPMSGGGGFL